MEARALRQGLVLAGERWEEGPEFPEGSPYGLRGRRGIPTCFLGIESRPVPGIASTGRWGRRWEHEEVAAPASEGWAASPAWARPSWAGASRTPTLLLGESTGNAAYAAASLVVEAEARA